MTRPKPAELGYCLAMNPEGSDHGAAGGGEHRTQIRAALIGAAAVIIAALITGAFLIYVNRSDSDGSRTTTTSSQPPTSQTSHPSTTFTRSSAPTTTPSVAAQSGSLFLADLDPSEGTPAAGPVDINGTTYPHSLNYRIGGCQTEGAVTYTVGRKWSQLTMTVGLRDKSNADAVVQFEVYADGQRIYNSGDVSYGQERHVDVPISDALDIKLAYIFVRGDMGLCSNAGYAAWGDPTLS